MTAAAQLRMVLLPAGILVGVVAAWEVGLRLWRVPAYVLPAPIAIVLKAWQESSVLGAAIAVTLSEAVVGYLLGNALGFALAVLFFYQPAFDRIAMMPIVASHSVPAVAYAPVIVLWFGVGMTSKIVVVAFVTCFIGLQNQLEGLRQCDHQAVNVLRSFGASEWRIFWVLRLPASLPFLFIALRIGSIRSVIIALVAEMLGAYRGVGWVIYETTNSMDYLKLWAAVVSTSAVGVAFFVLVSAIERRLLWWHVSVSGARRRSRRRARRSDHAYA